MKMSVTKPVLYLITISLIFFSALSHAGVKVEIEGLPEALEENALAYISLNAQAKRLAKDDETISPDSVKRLYGRATDEIKRALQPYGYYSPLVSSELEEIVQTDQKDEAAEVDFIARFSVNPGPQVVLRNVTVEVQGPASKLAQIRTILEASPIASGQALNHQ
ncbi:MAG: POTRA domain-containing protein, partial [Pseudomonadales bacterium]|nr:POTRA domain-containing protein [Pseudomonadales bacterium]